ncbi:MAG: response regulator transcription factor [Ignavibacteriales bacterium]|nr:response regulator transcription factor [Ignavibacteriales bacterium]
MKLIRTVIIEDDKKQLLFFKNLLKNYVKEVKVVGTASNVKDGIKIINELNPELLFLDVVLGNNTSFEILKAIDDPTFKIIFITGYEKYAVKAFEFAALDYLVKPIIPKRLQEAISRFQDMQIVSGETLNLLAEAVNEDIKRIRIKTANGYCFYKINEIVRFEIEGFTAKLYLESNEIHTVNRPLNYFEKLLDEFNFVRIHDKYLVNVIYVKEFKNKYVENGIEYKSRGGFALLRDGTYLQVSSRKKEILIKKMKGWTIA